MSKHYFSYSGGTVTDSTKKCVGTRYTEHVPLHHVGSAGHVVHFGASRALNVEAPFSCSGGTGTDSTKKSIGTHYAKLVLLHPV
jgi:hypothetical protein